MIDTLRVQQILEKKLGPAVSTSGADHNYPCPFCAKKNISHRLHVNYTKGDEGMAICHGCGYGTSSLLRLARDLGASVSKRLYRYFYGKELFDRLNEIFAEKKKHEIVSLPESFVALPRYGQNVFERLLHAFVRRRGFTYKEVERYGVGYLNDAKDPARNFLIFPFFMNGKCVYWQGRRVVGSSMKSWNPPSTDKRSIVFGYDQAIGAETGVLVEGPFDAIACSIPGYAGIGLTSKTLRKEQVAVLAALGCRRFVVCLDADTKDDEVWTSEQKRHKRNRSLQYAIMLRRSTGAEVGILTLRKGDPASNKSRMPHLLEKRVSWIPNSFSGMIGKVLGVQ